MAGHAGCERGIGAEAPKRESVASRAAASLGRAATGVQQCFPFPGIGPAAESNPATIRIKYGINPGISGICPIPAAESKVGYIPLFWRATVAWSRGARAPLRLGQARALAMASTPARRFCATRPCTLYFLGLVP